MATTKKNTKVQQAPSKKSAAKSVKTASSKQTEKDKDADSEEGAEATTTTSPKGTLAQIVKKLIFKGKERGYITYDELNAALPADDFSSEQIEDAMSTLADVGIQMSETDDKEEEEEEKETGEYESGGNISADDTGRTDDPVRMYLREMGSV